MGRSWPELPAARQRAFLTALIKRIDVVANRIDIHLRPTRLGMVDIAATPSPGETDDETQILSVPIELRRSTAGSSQRSIGASSSWSATMHGCCSNGSCIGAI